MNERQYYIIIIGMICFTLIMVMGTLSDCEVKKSQAFEREMLLKYPLEKGNTK